MLNKHCRYRLFVLFLLVVLVILFLRRRCRQSNCPEMDLNTKEEKIPNIVHLIIGQGDASQDILERFGPRLIDRLMPRASGEFQLINYLVLLAVRIQIQPDQLFVHYHNEPRGFWWIKAKMNSELNLTLHRIRDITSIYNHPLYHHAHRSDVARLEILYQYGGIYLDFDVLVLRSFATLIANPWQVQAILGWENEQYRAICNAVLIAPMHSPFIRLLYQSYQSVNTSCWACHSVLVTGQLANLFPNDVHVLSERAFFQPSWSNIDELYLKDRYDFTTNYACHLWNTYVGHLFLQNLTLENILRPKKSTTFIQMIVQAIGREKLNEIALSERI